MGTQQILQIVLSVIVVGAAITIGIQMFDTQHQNMVKDAIVMDLQTMAAQAQAWYRTPRMAGGGGNWLDRDTDGTQPSGPPDNAFQLILQYINRDANTSQGSVNISNENADYSFTWTAPVLIIRGVRTIQGNRLESMASVTLNEGYEGINITPVVVTP